jgi:hypothetical protein
MGAAAVVIALVGLVFPITLILAALAFDAAVLMWALYRLWHDRAMPRLVLAASGWRSRLALHVTHRPA